MEDDAQTQLVVEAIPQDDTEAEAKLPKALHPSQLVEGHIITGVVTRVQDSFGFIR